MLAMTALWLASNRDSITGSRWNTNSAWHSAVVQLLKHSLAVNWHRAPVERSGIITQVFEMFGEGSNYKDHGSEWLLLYAIEVSEKKIMKAEND